MRRTFVETSDGMSGKGGRGGAADCELGKMTESRTIRLLLRYWARVRNYHLVRGRALGPNALDHDVKTIPICVLHHL